MKERPPVDKYSKADYEAGLARIAEKQIMISSHPLQEELKLHKDLRSETASPYPFDEEEKGLQREFEKETAELRREVAIIEQDLRRQLSNAQTEATKIHEERGSREMARSVLPKIAQIETDTIQKMGVPEINKELPTRARAHGWAVINTARYARNQIASEKSPLNIARLLGGIQKLYDEFVGLAGNVISQDRFGHSV